MVSFAIYTTCLCSLSLLVFVDADTEFVSATANCKTLGVVTFGLEVPELLAPETPHRLFFEEAQLEAPPVVISRDTPSCLVGDPSLFVQNTLQKKKKLYLYRGIVR